MTEADWAMVRSTRSRPASSMSSERPVTKTLRYIYDFGDHGNARSKSSATSIRNKASSIRD